jgi:predicted pyridoxine 5'-phosphate oxidase superfamily flavin-nucleotide-binding protein
MLLLQSVLDQARITDPQPKFIALATSDTNGRPSVWRVRFLEVRDACVLVYADLHSRSGKGPATAAHAVVTVRRPSVGERIHIEGPVAALDYAAPADDRDGQTAVERLARAEVRRVCGRAGGAVAASFDWQEFLLVPDALEFERDRRSHRDETRALFRRDDAGRWARLDPI